MNHQLLTAAATAILWSHVAVIAFNIFGLIVIPLGAWRAWGFVRVFWWRALHLGALAIVALQAVLGQACFAAARINSQETSYDVGKRSSRARRCGSFQ